MRDTKILPNQSTLRALLDYDSETGFLTWRSKSEHLPHSSRWNILYAGKRAGSFPKGNKYRVISIDDDNHMEHRIIYKWMTGKDPVLVDHKDGNKLNNKWNNLREATETQNRCNAVSSNPNSLGIKGLRKTKLGQWFGMLHYQKKCYQTIRYDDKQKAVEALEKLRASVHGQFAKN